jgi:hypothetical protein
METADDVLAMLTELIVLLSEEVGALVIVEDALEYVSLDVMLEELLETSLETGIEETDEAELVVNSTTLLVVDSTALLVVLEVTETILLTDDSELLDASELWVTENGALDEAIVLDVNDGDTELDEAVETRDVSKDVELLPIKTTELEVVGTEE